MSPTDPPEGVGFDPQVLFRLKEELDAAEARLQAGMAVLDVARRRYAKSRAADDWPAVEAAQAETDALLAECSGALEVVRDYAGVTQDDLAEVEAERMSGMEQVPRAALTADLVEITADVDAVLAQALDAVEAMLPAGWLDEELPSAVRLHPLRAPDGILLTKGLRPESEVPSVHRLRQTIFAARDYLQSHPSYDFFAGATLLPTLAQFGREIEHLRAVGGDVDGRLRNLWAGAGCGVDATFFELLTAARCAGLGRRVSFIKETAEKTPDLECEDPFPVVIECKRQDQLSPYELEEEVVMRAIFRRLRDLARAKGLSGTFELRLTVEAKDLDIEELAGTVFRQRLAARPSQALQYGWGAIAFHELPRRGRLNDTTFSYSPAMLEQVFGWNTDLPEWDGICCSIGNGSEHVVDEVRNPLALLWNNEAPLALRKRTWAPSNLFGSATHQIYPGAVGVIYVAYVEGAREAAADLRVAAYEERLKNWEHRSDIRIPISVLSRLYPRPTGNGGPDLIESSIQVLSSEHGDASLFDDFPTNIFTRSPNE